MLSELVSSTRQAGLFLCRFLTNLLRFSGDQRARTTEMFLAFDGSVLRFNARFM